MPTTIFGPDIVIADEGGAEPVYLTEVHAPNPIPIGQAEYGVELIQMRQGAEGSGLRAVQLAGASEDDENLEFVVAYLSDEQFAKMHSKFYRQPAILLQYSFDNGSTWHLASFQKNGWQPGTRPEEWEKKQATIRLHRLGDL